MKNPTILNFPKPIFLKKRIPCATPAHTRTSPAQHRTRPRTKPFHNTTQNDRYNILHLCCPRCPKSSRSGDAETIRNRDNESESGPQCVLSDAPENVSAVRKDETLAYHRPPTTYYLLPNAYYLRLTAHIDEIINY